MNEVLVFQIRGKLPPLGKGCKDSYDDLVCWLQAVHLAQMQAGELYDDEAWHFFNEWHYAIGD